MAARAWEPDTQRDGVCAQEEDRRRSSGKVLTRQLTSPPAGPPPDYLRLTRQPLSRNTRRSVLGSRSCESLVAFAGGEQRWA